MSIEKATSSNGGTTEEVYEFTAIPRAGKINVANYEHGAENANKHTYTVSMADGGAVHGSERAACVRSRRSSMRILLSSDRSSASSPTSARSDKACATSSRI